MNEYKLKSIYILIYTCPQKTTPHHTPKSCVQVASLVEMEGIAVEALCMVEDDVGGGSSSRGEGGKPVPYKVFVSLR